MKPIHHGLAARVAQHRAGAAQRLGQQRQRTLARDRERGSGGRYREPPQGLVAREPGRGLVAALAVYAVSFGQRLSGQ